MAKRDTGKKDATDKAGVDRWDPVLIRDIRNYTVEIGINKKGEKMAQLEDKKTGLRHPCVVVFGALDVYMETTGGLGVPHKSKDGKTGNAPEEQYRYFIGYKLSCRNLPPDMPDAEKKFYAEGEKVMREGLAYLIPQLLAKTFDYMWDTPAGVTARDNVRGVPVIYKPAALRKELIKSMRFPFHKADDKKGADAVPDMASFEDAVGSDGIDEEGAAANAAAPTSDQPAAQYMDGAFAGVLEQMYKAGAQKKLGLPMPDILMNCEEMDNFLFGVKSRVWQARQDGPSGRAVIHPDTLKTLEKGQHNVNPTYDAVAQKRKENKALTASEQAVYNAGPHVDNPQYGYAETVKARFEAGLQHCPLRAIPPKGHPRFSPFDKIVEKNGCLATTVQFNFVCKDSNIGLSAYYKDSSGVYWGAPSEGAKNHSAGGIGDMLTAEQREEYFALRKAEDERQAAAAAEAAAAEAAAASTVAVSGDNDPPPDDDDQAIAHEPDRKRARSAEVARAHATVAGFMHAFDS